jgi:NADH-quinone oxidoreductase subunit M
MPSSLSRIVGLIGSGLSLIWTVVQLSSFDPEATQHLDLGLRFVRFSLDSLGFTMVLLTNAVIFLIYLANFQRSIVNETRFTALTFLMQFGLVGIFTTSTILGFYIFWELTLLPVFLILYWFGTFEKQNRKSTGFAKNPLKQ